MEKHTVQYGGRTIDFVLERKNVKNINLKVRPDMTVVVSANSRVPEDYIMELVKSKAAWIAKSQGYFKAAQPEGHAEKEYVSGESFRYLGRQYRLKVEEAERESVRYYRGYIEVRVKDKGDRARKESLVKAWFREKARLAFQESLDKMHLIIEKYGIEKPSIQIRVMKARWGSCIRDKSSIMLNYDLIRAPRFCIDYVVLHELLHFKHGRHDAEFYHFLAMLMPDWKQRKAMLDGEVVRGM